MSATYVPPAFYLIVATAAARNALTAAAAPEGTLVYNAGDQITYQRNAQARTGTDADWDTFSALNPYQIPQFTAFSIAGVGAIQVDGATISGSKTFVWATSPSANVAANSLTITDVTAAATLATAQPDDGTQAVTLPSTITLHAGDSHAWRIAGQDSKGNAFSRDYTVTAVAGSDLVYYVRTDGSDSNNGLANNAGGAWLTLQHAALLVSVGDKVNVAGGTYDGFTLGWDAPQSGASGHPIWFATGASAAINHRNPHTFDAIDVEACSFVKITGFVVTNDGTVTRAGVRVSSGGSGNEISNNNVTGTGRFGIITGFLTDSTIAGNLISGVLAGGGQNTGHGIYSANAGDRVDITDNSVVSCAGDGIHTNGDASQGGTGIQTDLVIARNELSNNNTLEGGAGINCDGIVDSLIENNLIYNTHSAGIALYALDASAPSTGNVVVNNTVLVASDSPKHCLRFANGSSGNVVFNNILYNANATGCAIACDADSIPVSDYNLVVDRFSIDGGSTILTLAQWRTATGQDTHSTLISSLSAVFNNVAAGDYSLKTSGPAINAGVSTFGGASAPADDLDGAARPFAGAYDLGCYESQTVSVLVTNESPADGASGVSTASVVNMTFDRDVDPLSIVFALAGGGSVPGSLSYDSPSKTATFTPTSALTGGVTYTATLSSVTGLDSVPLADPVVWTFSTLGAHRLFGNAYTPPTADGNDGSAITVAVNFYCSADGNVTKIWFYKAAANTGTHVAKLWNAAGTLLASKAFSGESASGWQSATLDTPVPITANTRYTASVYMPNGHYSFDNVIHTRSSDPLFTWDVQNVSFHPSEFVSGDAWPGGGSASDNFYGVDVEVTS